MAEKLNQAALPIVDFQTCSKPAYWWDNLRPSMICAGYESPDELKSACQVRKHVQEDEKDQERHAAEWGTRFLSYVNSLTSSPFYVTPKCYCL